PLATSTLLYTDPPPSDISTLSLHDALPISLTDVYCYGLLHHRSRPAEANCVYGRARRPSSAPKLRFNRAERSGECSEGARLVAVDRKSTRLNSSHLGTSYAVFCLKKKTKKQ